MKIQIEIHAQLASEYQVKRALSRLELFLRLWQGFTYRANKKNAIPRYAVFVEGQIYATDDNVKERLVINIAEQKLNDYDSQTKKNG